MQNTSYEYGPPPPIIELAMPLDECKSNNTTTKDLQIIQSELYVSV
jgi:hypothetical protein